jgi:hypothetical protein
VEVGTSKIMGGGQGSDNKPIGCGASGAYASGRDEEEEEDETMFVSFWTDLIMKHEPNLVTCFFLRFVSPCIIVQFK